MPDDKAKRELSRHMLFCCVCKNGRMDQWCDIGRRILKRATEAMKAGR